ncbi:hypothetical protein SK128_005987 [Halocaridina rubra]|uniref:Uncharacterized protein n=1 Tax=Halocaridina rubra TaxID=373956 RepID=A0AAN9A8S3_HALRR
MPSSVHCQVLRCHVEGFVREMVYIPYHWTAGWEFSGSQNQPSYPSCRMTFKDSIVLNSVDYKTILPILQQARCVCNMEVEPFAKRQLRSLILNLNLCLPL